MKNKSFIHVFVSMVLMLLAMQAYSQSSFSSSQLSCLLEPSSSIKISSQVPGVVEKINAERGQVLKKGQVLLVLKNGVERVALETAIARADFAARKSERNSELLRKDLLSGFERDELLTEGKLSELAVKEARERLEQRTTYSPISGVVVARHVAVGEFVTDAPVVELVALNPLYAEVVFRDDYYGQLKKGMSVIVETLAPVAGKHKGIITLIEPVIDAASGTFGVRVKVDNKKLLLPAGLKCHMKLPKD